MQFPLPTLEELKKHYDRHGLDRTKKRSVAQGKAVYEEPNHRTYRTLREDSLMETGRQCLSLGEYVELVRYVAGDEIASQALEEERGGD